MKHELGHKVRLFVAERLPKLVAHRIQRVAASEAVRHVAVMPDVHLASDYCVGTVVATVSRLYPHAIGGDIGCGMTAARFDGPAHALQQEPMSARLLSVLRRFVPVNRHSSETAVPRLPDELTGPSLSHPYLDRMKSRDGRVQFGTLGRGNHFIEFQADHEEALWIMIHSGSRAMGQAITGHHLRAAETRDALPYLSTHTDRGENYLSDLAWAASYARGNRMAMLHAVAEAISALLGFNMVAETVVESDHNHVRREHHYGEWVWVHRKGAQAAAAHQPGMIPGTMGTPSYHVVGRGCLGSLCSSSHGAGRQRSRSEARKTISVGALKRQMRGVRYDASRAALLRDEAPAAYKDIRKVMRAQRECVAIVRELKPILSYKG